MSLDRLVYKIECVSALAPAGCQYGPNAFAPKSAAFAAGALGNIAIYDNKPYRFHELSNLLFKGCNSLVALFELRFKFGNVLNIELFCFGSQNSSSSFPTVLLSDKLWGLLEKNTDMPP